jgi:hypothetical protein
MPKDARDDCEALGSFRPPADHTVAANIEAQAATIVLSFDASTQELGPLLEAAYCLTAQASCRIEASRDRYLCRLVPKSANPKGDTLRASFLDLVTDADLRAKVAPFHMRNSCSRLRGHLS